MYTLHNIASLPSSQSTNSLSNDFEAQTVRTSSKRIYQISKNGRQHDAVEHWLGKHNRKFEMLRTLTGCISASASTLVLLKVFGAI
jgi:hypothetical protein